MSLLRPKDDTKPWTGGYAPYDLIKEAVHRGRRDRAARGAADRPVLLARRQAEHGPQWSHELPVNFVTAASTELDGTSGTATYGPPYNHNGEGQHAWFLYPQKWLGVSHPINTAEDFVIEPLETRPQRPRAAERARRIQGCARKAEERMGRSLRQAA